jgi:hypothetical protein
MSLLFWYLPFMIMSSVFDMWYPSEKSTRPTPND